MTLDWNGLFGNFAIVAIVVVGWTTLRDLLPTMARSRRSLLLGFVFGLGAAACMALSTPLAPGVFFDLRSALVSLAAFFGGAAGAAPAAAIAITFRLWMG